jgi:magnesium transporter
VTTRCVAYRKDTDSIFEPERDGIDELIHDPGVVLWVDIEGATKEDEARLVEGFGLHPLVVEDILSESLPKIEDHGSYLYLILHGIAPGGDDPGELETVEMDLLIGESFVLTHHAGPMRSTSAVREQVTRDAGLLRKGPAHVAHALVDHVVDRYVPLMEQFDRVIDDLELEILKDPKPARLEEIFELKHSLLSIRRTGVRQRPVLATLTEGNLALIPQETVPFFRDVNDHFIRVCDLADSYRDLVSSALDAYLSMQSNRMNEVVKVLTLISTIMLPLSFIASLYGMNFAHMPELTWKYGYAFAWVIMLLTAGGFVLFFKKRGWL